MDEHDARSDPPESEDPLDAAARKGPLHWPAETESDPAKDLGPELPTASEVADEFVRFRAR